ncbi:zinc-dependent metalloprotease [Kocuria sp.]|uniref:zinc-dependent metalloprotease n=1 Tax=Kocuria sp. TaxID=1871328 RepID=UPI0026DBDC13|nr:zinc-dependent metalloprotease [Kocuria sp.]MDO4919199.1 zinc-dependent metalloprotease [Kocuria sp.]
MSTEPTRRSPVDWGTAAQIAAKVTPPGPTPAPREMSRAVESLRYFAHESVHHVHAITRLDAAENLRDSTVLVVDRAGWSKANTQTFSVLMQPVFDRLRAKDPAKFDAALRGVGATAAAAEMGALVGFLSARVLGQYDPYAGLVSEQAARLHPGGRLMFVAPNVLWTERELNVAPEDFRLWVCLHEQTHRVQFAAAPWLRDHMLGLIAQLSSLDATAWQRMRAAGAALVGRSQGPRPDAGLGPVTHLLTDAERESLSRITAVMSLLEGHANAVMDAVDASIVPSVKTIRRRFDARSSNHGALDRMVRSLMGMDAKMRQYSNGQRFVEHVVERVGMERFNTVWESPQTLPTEAEIHDPRAWMERVLG